MIVLANEMKYIVTWKHFKNIELEEHAKRVTFCNVSLVSDDLKDRKNLVSTIFVVGDGTKDDKNIARKKALVKALKKIFPEREQKVSRTAFWNAYLTMRNNKWK